MKVVFLLLVAMTTFSAVLANSKSVVDNLILQIIIPELNISVDLSERFHENLPKQLQYYATYLNRPDCSCKYITRLPYSFFFTKWIRL